MILLQHTVKPAEKNYPDTCGPAPIPGAYAWAYGDHREQGDSRAVWHLDCGGGCRRAGSGGSQTGSALTMRYGTVLRGRTGAVACIQKGI